MVVRRLMEARRRGWLTMRHGMRHLNGTEPVLVNKEHIRFVPVAFNLKLGLAGNDA